MQHTLELMTLFVKWVLMISALWFISQIQENANLREEALIRQWMFLQYI